MHKYTSDASWRKATQILLLTFACTWGMEYLMQPPRKSLYASESGIPLVLFGSILLFFGVLGLVGEWWREIGRNNPESSDATASYICRAENRKWPSFVAHAVLCAIYAGFTTTCFWEMVINGHFYGIRMLWALFILTVGHGWFAMRCNHVS